MDAGNAALVVALIMLAAFGLAHIHFKSDERPEKVVDKVRDKMEDEDSNRPLHAVVGYQPVSGPRNPKPPQGGSGCSPLLVECPCGCGDLVRGDVSLGERIAFCHRSAPIA